ncbi:uncharacterized protein [Panulirus ornatus]|uniref:uncharacterized protein isoform X2 n=1 Tax=Panulirus ornatus TaxID=150431 RepID=UPI003A840C40
MNRFLQLVLVRLLLAWREAQGTSSLPMLPSLLPPATTLLGPAEEEPGSPSSSTVFNQRNDTVLRAQVGTTAVLHCLAHDVGKNTDWQLHIRYVQRRDDGVYECQVSSHPPVSLFSNLTVLEATSEILGGPEKYMTVGSSLRLVCVLRDNTQPPTYVFWYHDHHMINYDATREVRVENNGGLSVLFLSNVRPADSGNYTCAPSNAKPARIQIHVLKGGETPAAIHSGSADRRNSGSLATTLPLVLCLALCLASTYLSRTSYTSGRGRDPTAPGTTEDLVALPTTPECPQPAACICGTHQPQGTHPHAPDPHLQRTSPPVSASASHHHTGQDVRQTLSVLWSAYGGGEGVLWRERERVDGRVVTAECARLCDGVPPGMTNINAIGAEQSSS